MSELLRKRVSESVGKVAKVFLHNGFRYEGKITNYDETYLEVLDFKTNAYKILSFSDIKDLEVKI